MPALVAFALSPIGRTLVVSLGVAAFFFSWLYLHDAKVATKATDKLVTKINREAEKLADEAVKARAPSLRTGAASRLRDATNCRNC